MPKKSSKKRVGRPAKAKVSPVKVPEDVSEEEVVDEVLASDEDDGLPQAKMMAIPMTKPGPASRKKLNNAVEKEYEVDKILNINLGRNNKREYLVKWVGYNEREATWEPEENLDCPALVKTFQLDLTKKVATPSGKPKGKGKKPTQTKKPTKNAVNKEYEVDRILNINLDRKNGREYLVKWVGYSEREATWEPEENLDCPEKLQAFNKKLVE